MPRPAPGSHSREEDSLDKEEHRGRASPQPSSTNPFLSSSLTLPAAPAIAVTVRPTTSPPLTPRHLVHNDDDGTPFPPPPPLIQDNGDNGSKSSIDGTLSRPLQPLPQRQRRRW
ncbi:hypothetical protein BDQ17DRAFT_1548865 [Cyathus striatus]|nr:hypothetical protein BDQ17DRAFT_1548865 [Cyathus striatus]